MTISDFLELGVKQANDAIEEIADELSSNHNGVYVARIGPDLTYAWPAFKAFDPSVSIAKQIARWACTIIDYSDINKDPQHSLIDGGSVPLPDHGIIHEYPCGCRASSLLIDDLEPESIKGHIRGIVSQMQCKRISQVA